MTAQQVRNPWSPGDCIDCGTKLPTQFGRGRPRARCYDCYWKHERSKPERRDPARRAADYQRRKLRSTEHRLRTVCLDCHELAVPGDARCPAHKTQAHSDESRRRRAVLPGSISGQMVLPYFTEADAPEAIDINTPAEFELAERLAAAHPEWLPKVRSTH